MRQQQLQTAVLSLLLLGLLPVLVVLLLLLLLFLFLFLLLLLLLQIPSQPPFVFARSHKNLQLLPDRTGTSDPDIGTGLPPEEWLC